MAGFCFVVHYLVSSLSNHLIGKESELVALLKYHWTVSSLCLFLMVLWVGLKFVIAACPSHTH